MKSICILSFTNIAKDARVLRQVDALAPFYQLTVIGYGTPHPTWTHHPRVEWVQLPEVVPLASVAAACKRLRFGKLFNRLHSEMRRWGLTVAMYLGGAWHPLYEIGYRFYWGGNSVLHQALRKHHDAYHANDWKSVPMMARAASRQKSHLIIDLHEYAPLEWDNRRGWWRHQQMISHILRKFAPQAAAITTVAPLLADKYEEVFGFRPIVVMNAPEQTELPEFSAGSEQNSIRLIHHGIATPIRKPEVMIETIALCDERYSLHLMFMQSDYVETLRALAEGLAPTRVFFHEAVPPQEIVPRIAEFDVGFNFIPPTTFNYLYSLPNKFLEGIVAGLAICIGPSPSMQAIVEQHQLGVSAASFEPADLAAALNQTTTEEWRSMQRSARRAAASLNAQHEMQKVVEIYERLMAKSEDFE